MVGLKNTLVLILLLINASSFAAIISSVNKTKISDIETLQLTIKSDTHINNNIDFSALRRDFSINSQRETSSFKNINGKRSTQFVLRLNLEPRRHGILTIPIFKMGKNRSKPIKITVSSALKQDFSKNLIFIKSEVDKSKMMVQEQVIYTVNLYSKVNVSIANLNFKPTIIDAIVKPLKRSKAFKQVKFKGKQLLLNEIKFAIYPQKTGKIIIPKIKENVSLNNSGKNSHLLLFAPAISLNVSLPDKKYPLGEHWLPTNNLKLFSQFNDKNPVFRVGEAISRKITIKAEAQTASQLPELKLSAGEGFEQYLDERKQQETILKDTIKSTVAQTVLIVPNKPGKQILPAISVSWFDLSQKKSKTATLPALQIEVENVQNIQPDKIQPSNLLPTVISQKLPQSTDINWFIATFIFAGLWLLTLLFLLLRTKSKPNHSKKETSKKQQSAQKYLSLIKKYAKQNDALQTKSALAQYLLLRDKNADIEAFASNIDDEDFARVLSQLQQHLYQQGGGKWDGAKFWQVFSALSKQAPTSKKSPKIPDLYPISSRR